MQEQDHWKEGWTVHYVEPEQVIVKDPQREIPEGLPDNIQVTSIVGVGFVHQTEILYCKPLIITIDEDPVYGTKKKVTSWGDQFNFEAIRIDYTGLTATFFARLPNVTIEPGSIILHFKERQWWKVNGVQPAEDGINIYCMPSELKPSFS